MSYSGFGNMNAVTVKKNILSIDTFKGVDITSSSSNVNPSRSPEAPNMIRDVPGKVRKRMGYHLLKKYDDCINGVYFLGDKKIVHSGTKLYEGNNEIYSEMNNSRSMAWRMGEKLYIVDGKKYLVYDGTEVKSVSEKAYIPTVVINCSPDGTGTVNEPYNLMGRGFTQRYYADGTSAVYQLAAKDLDSDKVSVEILQSDGTWLKKEEGNGFSVNRTTGKVTFTSAPAVSPKQYSDNIKITAYKTFEGYAEKINKCTISCLYGVKGTSDRIFLSGNPEFPNQDWFSELNDPTFIGDNYYNVIGQKDSAITGYSIINSYLATHKMDSKDGRNIIVRYGEAGEKMDGVAFATAKFNIVNTIQGEGANAPYTFAYLNEPLFVTPMGVYAITAADITAEKYSQNRSFYINGEITEEDLKNAFAVAWRDFYVLATDKRIYLLDGQQKIYEKNAPYSTFQYECYYWEIPHVNVMWKENDILCLGFKDGRTVKFYTDKESPASYNDEGKAIKAKWDIPDLNGSNFYKNKTFRYVSVRLAAAIATGVKIYAQSRGLWSLVADAKARARYFDFSYIDFGKINFSSDTTPRTVGNKIKVKKVDKARFSLRNEELNEPFGIYNVAFEYTESGNFKG